MKCPKCNGTGFVPTNVFGVNGAIKCDFCDGTGVFITNNEEPMTKEEWFCGLSTEEKAEMLANESKNVINDFENFDFKREHKEFWEMWLKQSHREE